MVLRTPDGSVLNGNDCGLDTLLLRRIAAGGRPTVFLFTLNFLANGYPYPYLRADSPDLSSRTAALRDEVVEQFRSAMDILGPELSLAFAGPVTFADAVNAHLDDLPEARDWRAMVTELRAAGHPVHWPAPGSSFVVEAGRVAGADVRPWDGYEATHRAGYAPPLDRYTSAAQPDRSAVVAAARGLVAGLRAGRELLGPGPEWSTHLVLSAVDGRGTSSARSATSRPTPP
jgi:hypothetical protein